MDGQWKECMLGDERNEMKKQMEGNMGRFRGQERRQAQRKRKEQEQRGLIMLNGKFQ